MNAVEMIRVWDVFEKCICFIHPDEIREVQSGISHPSHNTVIRLADGTKRHVRESADWILKLRMEYLEQCR